MNNFKPAVARKTLFLLGGMLWSIAGIILLQYSVRWLSVERWNQEVIFGCLGIVLAILFYQQGFQRIVRKNLARLHTLPERPCLFAFASWRSYLIIAVMMSMGILLRHSSIPKEYLAVPYEAMGGTLLIGSVQYYLSWIG